MVYRAMRKIQILRLFAGRWQDRSAGQLRRLGTWGWLKELRWTESRGLRKRWLVEKCSERKTKEKVGLNYN